MKVAVIGAGIAGITAAYYLARQGNEVTVYEQERYPAMQTSFANGGQVSVSNSEVWTTWSNVFKGAKWIFQKDAPLLIRPRLDWQMFKWLSKFLFHTARGDYTKNTKTTIQMGLASRELYNEIIKEENLESFDQSYNGILHFYKDGAYWDAAVKAKTIYDEANCEWSLIDGFQVKTYDPALKDIQGVIGGAVTKDDWTGDIHKFCKLLTNTLITKYKVEFCFDTKINHLIKDLDSYDRIVVANGVGSVALANTIGDSLDIYPVKGYSITINATDKKSIDALPKVSLLDDQAKIVTATLGTRLRVAGTAELTGENYDIRRDRIEPLLNWVHENLPNVDTSDYSSWACLRPMTANMMPIVKQSKKNPKVFYHTGHGHLGWTLAPYTAKQLSELI